MATLTHADFMRKERRFLSLERAVDLAYSLQEQEGLRNIYVSFPKKPDSRGRRYYKVRWLSPLRGGWKRAKKLRNHYLLT